jgi:hypothetical protein
VVTIGPRQTLINAMGAQLFEQHARLRFQDFIRGRMNLHCRMVEDFGFGSFDKVRETIEDVMTEIWVTTLDTLEAPNNPA